MSIYYVNIYNSSKIWQLCVTTQDCFEDYHIVNKKTRESYL